MAFLTALTCLAGLSSLFAPASAYPYYWADPRGNFLSRAAPACTAHPENRSWGGHPGTQQDPSIAVTLTEVGGVSAGTTVCPGQTYTVLVSWGAGSRRAIATSTYGTFASAAGGNTNFYYSGDASLNCPNRLITRREALSVSDTLTFPCGVTGTNEIRVSSATGSGAIINQATASFTINPACGVGACAPSGNPTVTSPPATAAAPPPVLPTPTQSPTAVPVVTSPPATAQPVPTTGTQAPVPAPSGCTPSSLNYACSTVLGGVTVHYSVAGNIPVNPCTGAAGGTLPQGYNSGAGLLHMAVAAPISGYVGFGFATRPNFMPLGDYIVGWTEGDRAVVNTFYTNYDGLSPEDIKEWAVHKGVARVDGNLVVCFTRPVTSNDATVAKTIDPTQTIPLNWVLSPVTGLIRHTVHGGGTLNLASGQAQEFTTKKNKNIIIHGALMSAAFALLLPLGALFPCHRWVLGNTKLGGVHLWFRAHVLVQCAGVALATVGFAWAWVHLDDPGKSQGTVGDTHKILGIIVYGLMCLQLVGGFLRPSLDSKMRPLFTHGHRWGGRIAILGSWAVIYLGIYLYHKGIYQAKYLPWIIPVAASMGVLLLLDVGLTIGAFVKGKSPGAGSTADSRPYDADRVQVTLPGNGKPEGQHVTPISH